MLTGTYILVTISFCDSTWKKKDGGCFKVFPDFKNWLDAQRTCQSNSATLANIDSISKQNYVFGKIFFFPRLISNKNIKGHFIPA